MVSIAALACAAPLKFSIATVFLFAVPHNWIEARYFVTRLPCRWQPAPEYFIVAMAGTLGLGVLFALLPWLARVNQWDEQGFTFAWAAWSSAMIGWVALLIQMRSRQKPRRDWTWTTPVAFALASGAWYAPDLWGIALVYLHPLMALWILGRELRRRAPKWSPAFHSCVVCLPAIVAAMWWGLAGVPPLEMGSENLLTLRIASTAERPRCRQFPRTC